MNTAPATPTTLQGIDPWDRVVGTGRPSPSTRVITLIYSLIAFGEAMLATLQTRPGSYAAQAITSRFGTNNVAAVIARLTRALRLAGALEDRVARTADNIDAAQDGRRTRAASNPTQTLQRTTDRPRTAGTGVTHLPTARQLAERIRHQPIGCVLEELAVELGITRSDTLWQELEHVIRLHGGNTARMIRRLLHRALPGLTALLQPTPRRAGNPSPTVGHPTGPP